MKEVAELYGVSVRTLHYYDEIGLLVPSSRSGAGYREYGDAELLRLQQILLGRELGLSLERCRLLLDDPETDRRALLLSQRAELEKRAHHTAGLMRAVDEALERLDSEADLPMNERSSQMIAEENVDGFDPGRYEQETKERWGHTDPYKEAARRTRGYGPEEWQQIKKESEDLYRRMADRMVAGAKAHDDDVMGLAEGLRLHIDRWFYPCSPAMHANLAAMYEADARFANNIDKFGEGLAGFLSAAIRANSARGAGSD